MRMVRRQRIRKKGMRADISGVRAVIKFGRRSRALDDFVMLEGGKGYISVGDKARNYGLVAFEKKKKRSPQRRRGRKDS